VLGRNQKGAEPTNITRRSVLLSSISDHQQRDKLDVELNDTDAEFKRGRDNPMLCSQSDGVFSRSGINVGVLVSDNGSTDGSQEMAEELGTRVISIYCRGYGAAPIGGIEMPSDAL
jgi:hypothetical protein